MKKRNERGKNAEKKKNYLKKLFQSSLQLLQSQYHIHTHAFKIILTVHFYPYSVLIGKFRDHPQFQHKVHKGFPIFVKVLIILSLIKQVNFILFSFPQYSVLINPQFGIKILLQNLISCPPPDKVPKYISQYIS